MSTPLDEAPAPVLSLDRAIGRTRRAKAGGRPLRIALVSTCAVDVPPRAYGGTELFVADLASGLVARGHEVVVYATGSSSPAGASHAMNIALIVDAANWNGRL